MKIFVMAVSLALASSVSNAQSDNSTAAGTGGGKGIHRATLHEELGLTEEQRNQIREIRQSGGSREEIRAVLTPEQQQKFDDMRQQRKGANGAKGVKGAGSTESSAAEKAPASE